MAYRLYVFRICRAAAVLFLGTCCTAHSQSPLTWEKARAEQIAAARREGIPVTLGDLIGKPVPSDTNAATYLAQIELMDKASPVTSAEADALDNLGSITVTPDQIAAARKAFEAHLDRYRLIRLVAGCAAYRETPGTLAVGGVTVPDEFLKTARFRDCGRWLSYKALLLTAEGKPLEGVKEAKLVFETAHLASAKGPLIAYLVGKGIEAIGFKTLRVILERSVGDVDTAVAVENAITSQPTTHLSMIMRGEVASCLSNSASMRKELSSHPGGSFDGQSMKDPEFLAAVRGYHYPKDPKLAAARMFDMNDAHYIAWMRRIIRVADLPYPQALARIRSVLAEAKRVEHHPDYELAAIAIGSMEQLPAVVARQAAIAEVTRSFAAVLVWKAKHGNLPNTLAEAMSIPAIDPYDLKPLRYRVEGSSFVIYSVGETGKFDGGKPDVRTPVTEVAIWWK
jgi:hypothetical protein